ncbi:LutC/YkgG family protein [Agarivorans sp. MS3-6]
MTDSMAKSHIMARLKGVSALAPQASTGSHQPWQAQSTEQRLQRFSQCLEAAHADVLSITSSSQLSACLIELAEQHNWKTAMRGSGGEWAELFELALAGRVPLSQFTQSFEWHKQALFNQTSVTLTGCDAAIADTGTVVLKPSEAEPRSLSLIAPCHVAVIKASQIIDNFPQLIEQQQWSQGLPSNVLLISGPSKTADIQQTLAYGAHGPSQLIIIVVISE